MTFEEEFPSLPDDENLRFWEDVLTEYCLDKARVKKVFDNHLKAIGPMFMRNEKMTGRHRLVIETFKKELGL